MKLRTNWALLAAVVFLNSTVGACSGETLAQQSAVEQANEIRSSADFQRGLIVCVGRFDSELLAELALADGCRVHAVNSDEEHVKEVRRELHAAGVYGKASVDTWDGKRLPYADSLVNLLIVGEDVSTPQTELMRVLAPRGMLLRSSSTAQAPKQWTKTRKPWPSDIDEWTHWLHGADCNAVARDARAAPPHHLQWIEGPKWLRHHNTTISFSAMVSAGGRVVMILNDMPPGLFGLPEKWVVQARDAFNGTLLWKRPLKQWGWSSWVQRGDAASRFDQPTDLQRKLVAVDDAVYLPLGRPARLVRLDAATGKTKQTYSGTEGVSEVLVCEDKLLVSLHRPADGDEGELLKKCIKAYARESGEVLWQRDEIEGLVGKTNALRKYTSLFLAAGGGRLFYADSEAIVALDSNTGEELWRVARPPQGPTRSSYASLYMPDLCSLVVCEELLLFAQTTAYDRIPWNEPLRTRLWALKIDSGQKAWEQECGNWGYGSPADVFVVDDVVWVHAFGEYAMLGLDLSTGKVAHRYSTAEAMDGSHHHRCYRNKATVNYALTARRGVEFIEFDTGENLLNHWIRGACRYGIVPCNGMLYVPPDPCMCYATAKVNGMLALCARRRGIEPTAPAERLRQGPALGKVHESEAAGPWPTYRHDARRSATTTAAIGSRLKPTWQTRLGGRLSAVTIADGMVFVAAVDRHTVHALDETSGERLWQFTAGGPIDSPPTFFRGTVLFGSADGHVYCLRATDGELVWRFQAAPADVRISSAGQLESAWPVHGNVLVQQGVAYVAAGRSSFLDGGIRLYALNPATGAVLQTRTVYAPDPATGRGEYDATLRYDMPPERAGALSDILVSDGSMIYMRHLKIDPADFEKDFRRDMTETQRETFYKKQTGRILDFGPQVVSTAGLLDGSWYNQTFWSFENGSHCRLLVFDEEAVYGARAYSGKPHRHMRSRFVAGSNKYSLFSDARGGKRGRWSVNLPVRIRAMVGAAKQLFVAGTPDRIPTDDPWAAIEGRLGGQLWVFSKSNGAKLANYVLDAPPVWDGMAAATGRLYFATTAGHVECWCESVGKAPASPSKQP